MRSCNPVILLFLLAILGGFIFLKDGFTRSREITTTSAETSSQVLFDRVPYLDYSENNFASAQKFGRTVLFFAATTWCSNCTELDKEITQNMSKLPKDITILKVDYDRDAQTKTKYGITMQTSLILLDRDGNEMKRWIGTGSFDDLMQNIN